jgi:hypothetical protein
MGHGLGAELIVHRRFSGGRCPSGYLRSARRIRDLLDVENLDFDLPDYLRHRQEATVGLRAGEV